MRLLAFLMTMSFAGLTYAGPKVEVTTSKGAFVIELAPDKAPKTVENFLAYVDAGFYSGTIFHRVIRMFMVQGGGMDATLNKEADSPSG